MITSQTQPTDDNSFAEKVMLLVDTQFGFWYFLKLAIKAQAPLSMLYILTDFGKLTGLLRSVVVLPTLTYSTRSYIYY